VADEVAETSSDRKYQHAIVEFARAIILTSMERFAEARNHLLSARQVFEAIVADTCSHFTRRRSSRQPLMTRASQRR
jgi:hypothetical protein